MKLITIVTEGLLKEKMIDLLKSHAVTGFTISRVEGEGSRGVRAREWEGPNLKIESIVSPEIGEEILDDIGARFFDDYSVVAWLSEVRVLRGEKFASRKCSRESGV